MSYTGEPKKSKDYDTGARSPYEPRRPIVPETPNPRHKDSSMYDASGRPRPE